jgi:osmoprotectant transport system permease protein
MSKLFRWLLRFGYLGLFIWWVLDFDFFAQWLTMFQQGPTVIFRTPLWLLATQHLLLVSLATGAAIIIGVVLGLMIHYYQHQELRNFVLQLAAIGETIPSMVIIALCVPIVGYGNVPIIIALTIYAILPILRNTIIGMESTVSTIQEAADGIGYSRLQRILEIDFPLATPLIIAGIKTALIINISAATIGATIGAGGFGVLIIAGIRTRNQLMVIQGSIPIILMAMLIESLLTSSSSTYPELFKVAYRSNK